MIHELRIYTLQPGKVRDYLDAVSNISRPIRGDDYGKLEGHWTSIGGEQVITLWSYADLSERERARERLAQNTRWANEFLSLLPAIVSRQENQILKPLRPLSRPAGEGNVYELRMERTLVALTQARLEELAAQKDLLGLWQVTIGTLNQAIHLRAHAQRPQHQTVDLGRHVVEAQSLWLQPSPVSPLT